MRQHKRIKKGFVFLRYVLKTISIPFWDWFGWCWGVLKGYSVTVKAATLIFISRRGFQEGKSGSIYLG